ncbi:MAG: hypothetical protein K2O29_04035 [Ruminococcus sp.]|nr:hypothetical protein [Ruminococcus sp.]MDE7137611.1 hypothetical protein [Ruminococcus sp.]
MKNGKRYRQYKERIRKLTKQADRLGTIINTVCPNCNGNNTLYYDKFDVLCCLSCDTWLEKVCSDPSCQYCSKKPATPSEAFFSEKPHYDSYRKDNLRMKYQQRYFGKLKHENSERNLK